MKKTIQRAVKAFIGLGLLLVVACQPPISTTPGANDSGVAPETLSEAANRTLANLPELKIKLPKSLSLDTSETASRVLGDTTELTVAMLPKLKSQAWYNLQSSNNSFMGFINKALGYLKSYASANTVPVGETFSMPFGDAEMTEMFDLPPDLFGIFTVNVLFNIQGDSAEQFSIYGDITMTGGNVDMGEMDVHVKTRFDVAYADADSTMDMYMQIDVTQTGNGQTYEMSMPLYALYDLNPYTNTPTALLRDSPAGG